MAFTARVEESWEGGGTRDSPHLTKSPQWPGELGTKGSGRSYSCGQQVNLTSHVRLAQCTEVGDNK